MTLSKLLFDQRSLCLSAALLGFGLAPLSGCGASDEENEAALERGREVMAEMQEDIIADKSGEVAEALRALSIDEMGRGAGDQFTFPKPGRELSRGGFISSALEQGATQAQAQAGWEQQSAAVYDHWRETFGEQSGQSADRLAMLWDQGHVPPLEGVDMPEVSWPADESGEALSRRITVGLLMRYGFSEAFSTQQWEQHRDQNRAQFIQIVEDEAGASAERAAELWDAPRG
ncbi:hypothetical protein OT109_05700 [Phycisphaeraceae bacterium D3-23]